MRKADAEINGLPVNTAASDMKYRDEGWSVQSRMRSYLANISMALAGVRRSL